MHSYYVGILNDRFLDASVTVLISIGEYKINVLNILSEITTVALLEHAIQFYWVIKLSHYFKENLRPRATEQQCNIALILQYNLKHTYCIIIIGIGLK